jgi:hypothetical protein
MANGTDFTQLNIGTFADIGNLLFEREGGIKGDSKTAYRRGESNGDITYVQRSG